MFEKVRVIATLVSIFYDYSTDRRTMRNCHTAARRTCSTLCSCIACAVIAAGAITVAGARGGSNCAIDTVAPGRTESWLVANSVHCVLATVVRGRRARVPGLLGRRIQSHLQRHHSRSNTAQFRKINTAQSPEQYDRCTVCMVVYGRDSSKTRGRHSYVSVMTPVPERVLFSWSQVL